MDLAERIQLASSFVLQSPPGEINDVLQAVRNLISDDESLEAGILPAARDYNLQQYTVVDVPGTNHQSIVSEAARIPSTEEGVDRFLDPRSKTSFKFDHLAMEASDPQSHEAGAEAEPLRAALETATITYLTSHFHDGVGCVFASADDPDKYIIQLVANKYNSANYWSGRWRSEYVLTPKHAIIKGRILVNVHYYEQGNVQLTSEHTVEIPLPPALSDRPPAELAPKILALIADEEGKYQVSLNDTYQEMGDKTFKALRRALPLTRQKIDWDKVLGYKLGAELASSKGAFLSS